MKTAPCLFRACLVIALALFTGATEPGAAPAAGREPPRWPLEKAWQWYDAQPWLVGFNYIPATAINTTEMWQADTFDPKTIDAELALAKQTGFNCARVFLQYLVWEGDPAGLKDRMAQFLAIADRHGLRTLFILFDICNFSPYPDPFLGKQPEPIPGRLQSLVAGDGRQAQPGRAA